MQFRRRWTMLLIALAVVISYGTQNSYGTVAQQDQEDAMDDAQLALQDRYDRVAKELASIKTLVASKLKLAKKNKAELGNQAKAILDAIKKNTDRLSTILDADGQLKNDGKIEEVQELSTSIQEKQVELGFNRLNEKKASGEVEVLTDLVSSKP